VSEKADENSCRLSSVMWPTRSGIRFPFSFGGSDSDLAHEAVQVTDESGHDLLHPGIGRLGEPRERRPVSPFSVSVFIAHLRLR